MVTEDENVCHIHNRRTCLVSGSRSVHASAHVDIMRGCCHPCPACLRGRAVVALLVAAVGAGGADDNHATTLAAVLKGRHLGESGVVFVCVCVCVCVCV